MTFCYPYKDIICEYDIRSCTFIPDLPTLPEPTTAMGTVTVFCVRGAAVEKHVTLVALHNA